MIIDKPNQQKISMAKLLLLAFSILILLPAFGQNPERKIHPQHVGTSQSFKAKVGQNRVAEFELLENSLTAFISSGDAKPNYDYFIGDYQVTSLELITLLGEPSQKISNGIWVYDLNPTNGCKVIIGIDPEGYLSYVTKKECN